MNKTEKKVYQILKKEGYTIEKAIKTRWHRTDLFGLWDFIAVNEKQIRFIQVSAKYLSSRPKEEQQAMRSFPCPAWATKEYWHWKRNEKEPRIEILSR